MHFSVRAHGRLVKVLSCYSISGCGGNRLAPDFRRAT